MHGGGLVQTYVRPLAWSVVDVGTPAGVGETVLKTYTIPANLLDTNGKSVWFRYFGRFAANANTKQLRIRCGTVTLAGTVVYNSTAVAYNGTNWILEGRLLRRTVDSQDFSAGLREDGTIAANIENIQQAASANDDATDMLLELTGQNGAASANDIVCAGHDIQFIGAP